MASSLETMKRRLRGLFGASDEGAADTDNDVTDQVDAQFEDYSQWVKAAADAMAADATAATYFYRAKRALEVLTVYIIPTATLTGHASNNATIVINKHDGAGGAATIVATITTTASWAAGTPVALTVSTTAGVALLTAGQVLSFQISKNASGVVVPAHVIQVDHRLT